MFKFLHKIKIAIERLCGESLPHVSEAKRYGNNGEDRVYCAIKELLPSCNIKRNVIVRNGNAEIDIIVLYQSKLFAIEVKNWKGSISGYGNQIVKSKTDYWTDELYQQEMPSPFKQIHRAIYLLKEQIGVKAWINSVVFFVDTDISHYTNAVNDKCFNNINDLIAYIQNDGNVTYDVNNAQMFFDRCTAQDYLIGRFGWRTLRCLIDDASIAFETDTGIITRKDISSIKIIHHWTYDDLDISLKNGYVQKIELENAGIYISDGTTNNNRVALSKLDRIEIGL